MATDPMGRAELLEALNQEMRAVSAQGVLFSHVVAGRLGINSTDMECLDFVNMMGPMTAGRLAEVTGLTTGAITGVIDRLERAGFARREKDPDDRRRVIIQPIWNERMGDVAPIFESMQQATEEFCAQYSDQELAFILGFLRGIEPVARQEIAKLRE